MAIEHFSNGYYKTEMSVQPYESGPTIEQGLYDFINRRFYTKTDAPVTTRIGLDAGPMFTPSAESGIPTNVIGLPIANIKQSGIHPSNDNVSVFVLKQEFAYMFNSVESIGESFLDSSNISDTALEEDDRKFFNLGDD